ncbi:hypothetical protein J437_LFUL010031 [Ladona fulva]|uniref:Uncharacterized protein n=1 Tax=Ladona fulva TaxID=123851 RepID=A0A8K0P1W7_LADFU|nr:hypothetical protein J437_LFUL010031 [Ladona fulva]
MEVSISHLLITRDSSGMFCIQPMRDFALLDNEVALHRGNISAQSVETQTNSEVELLLERQRARELRAHNEELQARLAILIKEKDVALSRLAAVSEENIRLQRALQRESTGGESASSRGATSISKTSLREVPSRDDDDDDDEECHEDGR